MAIYDTMQYIKPDVSTICVGMAASMGAFLLAAGTKGKRYALPNSEVMIHQPLGECAVRPPILKSTPTGFLKPGSGFMKFWPGGRVNPFQKLNGILTATSL